MGYCGKTIRTIHLNLGGFHESGPWSVQQNRTEWFLCFDWKHVKIMLLNDIIGSSAKPIQYK